MADKIRPAGEVPTYNSKGMKADWTRALKQIVDTVAPQMNPRRNPARQTDGNAGRQSTDHDY